MRHLGIRITRPAGLYQNQVNDVSGAETDCNDENDQDVPVVLHPEHDFDPLLQIIRQHHPETVG